LESTHENGKLFIGSIVGSIYSALIQPDIPIDKVNNDKL
jgi:hypothetical protein